MNRLVRPVYIGAVVNAREILLQLKRPFFVTKKTFFFQKFVESSCKEGRGQTMRGSGQDTMRNDQTQRASVYMMYKEHIQCRNYESAVV